MWKANNIKDYNESNRKNYDSYDYKRNYKRNKVVFGSDWMGIQDGEERIVDNNFRIFDKMILTKEEKAKILGENIRKVMKL